MKPSDFVSELVRWEGLTTHMYLDTRGYVTVGVGFMLPTVSDTLAYTWDNPSAVSEDYMRVRAMKPGLRADDYAKTGGPRMSVANINAELDRRLIKDILPSLQRLYFGSFGSLPFPAQEALVDATWQIGVSGIRKFINLHEAIDARDWEEAAVQCHVEHASDKRNQWRASLYLSCVRP